MRHWLPLAIIVAFLAMTSCKPKQVIVPASAPQARSLVFPDDWLGHWAGPLAIYRTTGKTMEIPMQFDFLPRDDGRYTWRITYDDNPPRDYVLRADTVAGRYWIDEQNSIELVNHQLGNKFVSQFEVEGQLLLIAYELRSFDQMTFEVYAGGLTTTPTGGQDSIPVVNNYYVGTWQQGILRRQEE